MSNGAGKLFTWLGVAVVLGVTFFVSCMASLASLSPEGRGFFREIRRRAGDIGRDERERRRGVNADYNLTFNDDGTAAFYGGGFNLVLPKGYKIVFPEKMDAEASRFDYYVAGAGGRVQVRFRREPDVGYDGWNYAGDKDALFKHAEEYAATIAGEAAFKGRPLATVAPSALETIYADYGYDGCYAYTPEQKERRRYEGEYFVFLGRGFENVVLFTVAFRPFNRDAAVVEGRRLAASFTFN